MQTAKRLNTVSEYYFSRKLREINELEQLGHQVLNLAIGSPDQPPHPSVTETLKFEANKPEVHGYQSYQGHPDLRTAIADFYQRKYQVSLNANNEILPMMGSKEAITHISMAYLNPRDKVLVPSLGYPTYQSVTQMVEAEVINYPLNATRKWEPDWAFFEQLDEGIKMIWINYPHMPTGASGSLEWLSKFVQIAQKNNILLIHDNPYSFILNDQPMSIFNIKGAKEVAIELSSVSKTFNMAGWRVGWACGQKSLLDPILRIKSNMDSGMFLPIQLAAAKALSLDEDWFISINKLYAQRRAKVFKLLDLLDCTYDADQQGMFVWAKVNDQTGDDLVDFLLSELFIFITPGKIFGDSGKEYVRISLCNPISKFEEAIKRIQL